MICDLWFGIYGTHKCVPYNNKIHAVGKIGNNNAPQSEGCTFPNNIGNVKNLRNGGTNQ